ncbi:hypothetical protein GCM10022419_130920 [Nonomuraea rosea]|uniref:HTH IS21-type domain-containing protein n=1 Tax=Nonomuraea rosea TaxID=638574 RepID=A0ABP7A135_9ACTN
MQALKNSGASLNAISRQLGLAFRTARKFANATSVDELLAPTLSRSSKLDQFKPYLTLRWNEGCTNAIQLHAEINAQGFTGSRRAVQGWLKPLRGYQEVQQEPCPPPKPRRVTGWIMSHPDHLDADNRIHMAELLARCPELNSAAGHVRTFATMMTNRDGHLLDAWITAVTADAEGHPHLAAFATGLRRDHAAVQAGLTLPYSNGPMEGVHTIQVTWNQTVRVIMSFSVLVTYLRGSVGHVGVGGEVARPGEVRQGGRVAGHLG